MHFFSQSKTLYDIADAHGRLFFIIAYESAKIYTFSLSFFRLVCLSVLRLRIYYP